MTIQSPTRQNKKCKIKSKNVKKKSEMQKCRNTKCRNANITNTKIQNTNMQKYKNNKTPNIRKPGLIQSGLQWQDNLLVTTIRLSFIVFVPNNPGPIKWRTALLHLPYFIDNCWRIKISQHINTIHEEICILLKNSEGLEHFQRRSNWIA